MPERKIHQESETIANIENVEKLHINNTYSDDGKKILKKNVALIFAVIIVIIFVITPIVIKLNRILNDRKNGEIAKSVFKSAGDKNDYLTSAHKYHKLAIDIYDNNLFLLFTSLEAYMYYMHAVTSKNDLEKHLNSALHNTASVKKQIVKNSWIYAFVCAIESECYYALDIPLNDDKWRKTISELENYVDNVHVELDDFYSPVVFECACHTLTLYFKKVALDKELFDRYGGNVLNQKMLKYQRLYTETYSSVADNFGMRLGIYDFSIIQDFYDIELSNIAIILARAESVDVDKMISNRFSEIKSLDNIIEDCRSRLKRIDYNKNNELSYLYFSRLIVRALYFKYIICLILEDVEGQNLIARECRNAVARVLRLPDTENEDSLYQMSCIADYIFLINEFQLDDAHYYYNREMKFMKTHKYANLPSS